MKIKRFEIAWFEGYDTDHIKSIAAWQPGAKNVRKARLNGRRNWPVVVRFTGTDETRGHVQQAVSSIFEQPFCIVREVL